MLSLLASSESGHLNLCFIPQVNLKLMKLILVLLSCKKKRFRDVWRLNDVQCRFVCCVNLSESVLSEGGLEALRKGFSDEWGGEKAVEEAENFWWVTCLCLTPPTLQLRFLKCFSLWHCVVRPVQVEGGPLSTTHCKGWNKTQRSELYFTASVEILIAIQAPHCLVKV